jgi:hypothetical protein
MAMRARSACVTSSSRSLAALRPTQVSTCTLAVATGRPHSAVESTPAPALSSGCWKLHIDHVLQADEGADLDCLVSRRGAFVPKDNH